MIATLRQRFVTFTAHANGAWRRRVLITVLLATAAIVVAQPRTTHIPPLIVLAIIVTAALTQIVQTDLHLETITFTVCVFDATKTLVVGVYGGDGVWPILCGTLIAGVVLGDRMWDMLMNIANDGISYVCGAFAVAAAAQQLTRWPVMDSMAPLLLLGVWIGVHHTLSYGILAINTAFWKKQPVWAMDMSGLRASASFGIFLAPIGWIGGFLFQEHPSLVVLTIASLVSTQRSFRAISDRVVALRQQASADAEAARAEARRLAQAAAVAEREQYIFSVVHDGNHAAFDVIEPLRRLRAIETPDTEQMELVQAAERAVENLSSYFGDLYDAAQMERGELRLLRDYFQIGAIVADAVDTLRYRYQRSGITLTIVPTEDQLLVHVDGRLLSRVYYNILLNAEKYMRQMLDTHPHCVTITLSGDATTVAVAISDTGPGIAPADLAMLGQRFTRLASSAGTEGAGSGIAFCLGIVTQHGGALHVASPGVGCGATFTIVLPRIHLSDIV